MRARCCPARRPSCLNRGLVASHFPHQGARPRELLLAPCPRRTQRAQSPHRLPSKKNLRSSLNLRGVLLPKPSTRFNKKAPHRFRNDHRGKNSAFPLLNSSTSTRLCPEAQGCRAARGATLGSLPLKNQPQRGCVGRGIIHTQTPRRHRDTTPLGLLVFASPLPGVAAFAATPGFGTKSRWDLGSATSI